MKNALLLFFFISLSANVYSQQKLIIMNAVALDTTRYEEYIGDAYFFEEWSKVSVISVGGVSIDNVKGNYNGLDGEWEIFHEDKYTNLPKNLYTEIQATFDESHKFSDNYPETITFRSKAHAKLKDKYVIVLIDQPNLKLYEQFYIVENENKKETPGKTMITKTLKRKSIYNVVVNDKFHDVKSSKKGLASVFGDKKAIEKILGQTKNKLKTSLDMQQAILAIQEAGLIK